MVGARKKHKHTTPEAADFARRLARAQQFPTTFRYDRTGDRAVGGHRYLLPADPAGWWPGSARRRTIWKWKMHILDKS
jgi:hypothetical protein